MLDLEGGWLPIVDDVISLKRKLYIISGIYGGHLLGVRSVSGLAFYDWETTELVRRIEITPKNVSVADLNFTRKQKVSHITISYLLPSYWSLQVHVLK